MAWYDVLISYRPWEAGASTQTFETINIRNNGVFLSKMYLNQSAFGSSLWFQMVSTGQLTSSASPSGPDWCIDSNIWCMASIGGLMVHIPWQGSHSGLSARECQNMLIFSRYGDTLIAMASRALMIRLWGAQIIFFRWNQSELEHDKMYWSHTDHGRLVQALKPFKP